MRKRKITKRQFINALKEKPSLFLGYTYDPISDEKAEQFLIYGDYIRYPQWFRTVRTVKSNHIIFSDDSRLYFDSFATRTYTEYSYGYVHIYVMSIHEKNSDETKYLVYAMDDRIATEMRG